MFNLFHDHKFQEAETRPGVIFCECGKTKKLRCQHKFEKEETIYSGTVRDSTGKIMSYNSKIIVLKCIHCGVYDTAYF